MKIVIDCIGGFQAVPYDSVTVGGMYLPSLNSKPEWYGGPFALLLPDGTVALDEYGRRAHPYRDLAECKDDSEVLNNLT